MSIDKNILTSKHTAGPWKCSVNKEGRVISVHTGETSDEISRGKDIWEDPNICGLWYDNFETSMANAHIISVAPESIEFISDLMEFFDFLELC